MARDYTKIKAWQLSNELALMIYKATKAFPRSEIWGLTSQMRRAAVSVPANIVEGSAGKTKVNTFISFILPNLRLRNWNILLDSPKSWGI